MNVEAQNDVMPILEEEIRRFETDRIAWLRFSPELEERYSRETRTSRGRTLLAQGLFSLLVYDFFLVGDYFMAPQHIVRAAIIRLGIFTPLVGLVALVTKLRRSDIARETSTSLLCFVAAFSILYLHRSESALVSIETQMGLTLVLLVMNCLLSTDLLFAIATSVLITCIDILWLIADHAMLIPQKMVAGGMLGWVVILTLAANYTMSRERRFSYLLQLRGRLQRGLLAQANAELLAISSTDRLTGLPNRRAYDTQLPELWAMTAGRKAPFSAVMVDVDHFKRLNDTYGHPYGDRVLQRVSSLLQQALRGEDDFVARFGGEEFIVLLPNTDAEAALKVAERIRTLVQVAGSPALQRDSNVPVDVWSTVSCGVATTWPTTTSDPSRLITEADAAMYRAKQEGRNRVCCAPASASAQQQNKLTIFPKTNGRA